MKASRKLVILCVWLIMTAAVSAIASDVPDQQIATWTCYYKTDPNQGMFSTGFSQVNDTYTMTKSTLRFQELMPRPTI
jgi:hypothetical protein